MDYAELVKRLREEQAARDGHDPYSSSSFRMAADAIEALIRERDSLLSPELFREHYQRGFKEGLEKAAEVVRSKFNAHGWDYHLPSVGLEMEAAIRALIPEDKYADDLATWQNSRVGKEAL